MTWRLVIFLCPGMFSFMKILTHMRPPHQMNPIPLCPIPILSHFPSLLMISKPSPLSPEILNPHNKKPNPHKKIPIRISGPVAQPDSRPARHIALSWTSYCTGSRGSGHSRDSFSPIFTSFGSRISRETTHCCVN